MQLVYFASPMCSWCWGFSPVIQQIKDKFIAQFEFRLVLAPFRVNTVEVMDVALRNYVLAQWHKVELATTQPFDFTFDVGTEFVYDTMPACRAIKALASQQAKHELNFLSAIQAAFYTQNLNVTSEQVLTELAATFKVDVELFIEDFHANEINNLLDRDFSICQQLGVNSYPMLMGIKEDEVSILANGFSPYRELEKKVQLWVRRN